MPPNDVPPRPTQLRDRLGSALREKGLLRGLRDATTAAVLGGRDARRALREGGALRLVALTAGPASLCGLAMKATRVGRVKDLAARDWALGMAPDVLVVLGVLLLGVALLAPVRPAWRRRTGLGLFQLLVLLVFAVDVLAFGYFRATGLTLDYSMFKFSLGRAAETAPVVGSEVTWATGLVMAAVPLWTLLAPWLIGRRTARERAASATNAGALTGIRATAFAAACFYSASLVSPGTLSPSVAREPILHLVHGYLAQRALAEVDPAQAPRARQIGPTKLVWLGNANDLNLVVIVLESTRADATTPYVSKLKTTPALKALAKEGTLVEHAYAVVPHTSKALVSILCGVEPRPSLDIVEATKGGMPARCLARLLGDAGYDTAFFQAPRRTFEHRAQLVSNMGYAHFVSGDESPHDGMAKVNYFGYEDAVMLRPSNLWLKAPARRQRPFFATYLTSTSHHPYVVPPSFPVQDFGKGRKGEYLNAVSYVDSIVAKILDQYRALGLYERTVFVVVGDHGEAFGEHGLSTHDDVLYDEGLRVPLVIRAPAALKLPRRVKVPVNQLSIAPTALSLLGLHGVGGDYEARSVFEEDGTRPLYASCYRNAQCLGVVREGKKLLHFFGDKPPLLFDLKADRRERTNLTERYPELTREWTQDLVRWPLAVEAAHANTRDSALAKYVTRKPPRHAKRTIGRFGSLLEVLKCSASRGKRAHVSVSCTLHVLKPLHDGYRLRVEAKAGTETGQFDHKPVRGLYPLRDWRVGDYITDSFDVRPHRSWEKLENVLCLRFEEDGKGPVPLEPATASAPGSANCLPIATVAPR